MLIIANLFILFSGCGYKSAPIYQNSDKDHQFLSKIDKIDKVKKIADI